MHGRKMSELVKQKRRKPFKHQYHVHVSTTRTSQSQERRREGLEEKALEG